MTENEYIKATNRAKVSAALTIMRDVLPGEDCGISDEEALEIISKLTSAESKLFSSYECSE